MRSQIFAKSLSVPLVIGALKHLELRHNHRELKNKLLEITNVLQNGLKKAGCEIWVLNSAVRSVLFTNSSILFYLKIKTYNFE